MGFQDQASAHLPETTESPLDCRKRSSQKCASPTAAEEEPTAKRQSMEQNDRPISLVLSKVRENDIHIFAYGHRGAPLCRHSLSDIDATRVNYAVQNCTYSCIQSSYSVSPLFELSSDWNNSVLFENHSSWAGFY